MFFSKNTDRQLACALSRQLVFQLTEQLGKYLGVPLIRERASRRTNQDIVLKPEPKQEGRRA